MPSFPISGGRAYTEVDEEDAWRFDRFTYQLKEVRRKDGTVRQYAFRKGYRNGKYTTIYLNVEILEAKLGRLIRPGYMTDHVDGEGLNNRRSNLREATNAENKANQRKPSGATSHFKGVSKHPCGGWQVHTKRDKRNISLGHFKAEIEAAQAYDAAALIIRPEFARLNFPNQPQPAHIIERVKLKLAGMPVAFFRQWTCRICGQTGHNARTCPRKG